MAFDLVNATGYLSSNLVGLIPNSKFQNDSIIIGTTQIELGNSSTVIAGLTTITSTNINGTTINLIGALTSNSITTGGVTTGGITCSNILMDGNLTGIGSNNMTQWNTITCNTLTANFLVGDGSLLTNVFSNFSAKTDKILTASTSLNIDFNLLFQPSVLAIDGFESVLFNNSITFNPNSKILKLSETGSYLQAHGANNTFGYFGGGNATVGSNLPWMATLIGGNSTISTAVFGWLFYNNSQNGDLSLHRRNNSTTEQHVMTFIRSSGFVGIGSNPTITKPFTIHNDFSGFSEFNLKSNSQEMLFGCDTTGQRSYIQSRLTSGSQNTTLSLNPNGGRVGIGGAPSVKFHVISGDIAVDRDHVFSFAGGYSANWYMEQLSSNNYFQITRSGESLGSAITISTSNNIGIGVSNPGERLEISGTTVSGNANSIAFDCVTNNTNYGLFIGGANTFNSGNGSIFVTPNLHIDSPIGNGSIYLNYYNNQYTVIRNRIDISDRRIKKDIVKIEKQSQFDNVFNLIKKVGAYTYKYRDIYRENDLDQYGFIAQEVLQNYPVASKKVAQGYLPNIMETVGFSYTVDNNKNYNFTIEGFELDINTKYLFYAFWGEDEKTDFDYLENVEPTSENTFSYTPVVNRSKILPIYYKVVIVGIYTMDKLGVSKDKLFQLGFAGTNALIIENENLKERVNQLENDLLLIKKHLNL